MAKFKYCSICNIQLDPYDTYQVNGMLICGECYKIKKKYPEVSEEELREKILNVREKMKKRFDEFIVVTVPKIEGFMKVEIARDVEKNVNIGYCISTINDRNIGEIESLYIEPDYRKLGIGNEFMRNALDWMDLNNVKSICIGVSVGNEEVLSFYKKYGFFPKTIILEQVNNKYK
ncbi:Acetyltransferase (GNAT) family protein [Caloranaerobacter azorensis DSM 13643]|uniref:Acetyltransferase (GNAT) family protein n=1 Tax=Caloranaerobacter azorensis DSM 13643 TaxID=1121264 RepID=A0A1M5UAT5_9FIRM|nr:GNAT family N-acetyltransferase [Caloranaerobacter azorensis]SHH60132.1 Acetyltransferase (GNAT) family protein [Caloranaerobacter azorensis DSM 13643]